MWYLLHMKLCRKCQRTLPLDCFWKRPSRRGGSGIASSCKECAAAAHKQWVKQNRDHVRESAKAWRESQPPGWKTLRKHGMVPTVGPCMICGDTGPRVVDHDHSCCSGEASCPKCRRGLLCQA